MNDTSFQEYRKREGMILKKHRWFALRSILSDFLGLLGGLVAITIFGLIMWLLDSYMKG